MKILVDADALPRTIREVLIRVAERAKVDCVLVANRAPTLPGSAFVRGISAGNAFDGADDRIIEELAPGDLVVTADIPLADRAITAGAEVLNQRGSFFTAGNVKHALAMRELMAELRITGEVTGGAAPFSAKDKENFTNALNRFLQKRRPDSPSKPFAFDRNEQFPDPPADL